jgi:hypothetical protein
MPTHKPAQANRLRERIKGWNDANKSNHTQYYMWFDFILGDQWREDEAKVFENYKKIPLTANMLSPMAAHMFGEQRRNTPQLQIDPDDEVDVMTADVRAALIKKICLDGNSKVIYQQAYQNAIIGGAGAYYWDTQYDDNDGFNQIIVPRFIDDTCKAYWDLGALKVCKQDGQFAGFRIRMTRAKFRDVYGKKLEAKIGNTALDIEDDSNTLNMSFNDEGSITIITDFLGEPTKDKLYQLSNGKILKGGEIDQLDKVYDEKDEDHGWFYYQGEPVRIDQQRMVDDVKIRKSLWAGDYELDATEFASKQLPVLFVDHNSYRDKHGKQIWRPFFKDARDTQKYINYLRTQMAYLVKISRNDQFIAPRAAIAAPDIQKTWRDPSIVQGALPYDAVPGGEKPERLAPFEIPQTLLAQYNDARNDLMATTGIYDVQMGNQGDVMSGAASDSQIKRGSLNTEVTRDALGRSIEVSGEIINEMIPVIYDAHRIVTLQLPDQGEQKVPLNKPMDDYGSGIQNDMTKGTFKIRLVPGQSYEGQKTENLQFLELLLQNQPQLFNLIADLVVENSPMANPLQLKNRLRALVPPEVLEAGKTGKPIPPKPTPPDPMIQLKQQELQMKMQGQMLDHQHKMAQLQQEQQKMMLDAHVSGADMTVRLQQIHADQEALQAQMADNLRDYQAEMARLHAEMHNSRADRALDANKHHSEQVLKILTHEPEHLKPKEPKNESKPKKLAS